MQCPDCRRRIPADNTVSGIRKLGFANVTTQSFTDNKWLSREPVVIYYREANRSSAEQLAKSLVSVDKPFTAKKGYVIPEIQGREDTLLFVHERSPNCK